jgi:hypothetical protein
MHAWRAQRPWEQGGVHVSEAFWLPVESRTLKEHPRTLKEHPRTLKENRLRRHYLGVCAHRGPGGQRGRLEVLASAPATRRRAHTNRSGSQASVGLLLHPQRSAHGSMKRGEISCRTVRLNGTQRLPRACPGPMDESWVGVRMIMGGASGGHAHSTPRNQSA